METGHRIQFRIGMLDGIPIAAGYFAVAFSLGITARGCGFSALQGFVASITTYASAGEYIGFTLYAANATLLQLVIMTVITNARYVLMGFALNQKLPPETPMRLRLNREAGRAGSVLFLWRTLRRGSHVGHRDRSRDRGGQCSVRTDRERTQRGAVRHVPGRHSPGLPQGPDRAAGCSCELCGEPRGALHAGYPQLVLRQPDDIADSGHFRRSGPAFPCKGCIRI